MATYVSMLRGVNVGGAGKVKIGELKRLYESLGLEAVRTYIQSGNLVFRSPIRSAGALSSTLERGILDEFGLDVTVILRTGQELEKLVLRNPFVKATPRETDKMHVTFLSDLPKPQAVAALSLSPGGRDRYEISGKEIFLYCPDGYGRTKLNNNALETKLGVRATTRNWATVTRLLEMARE
jgi:uncharacterized protein (DUF1697 family)